MGSHATRYVLFALSFWVFCEPVLASQWEICRMKLRITDVLKHPRSQLQAQVLEVSQSSIATECPTVGAIIAFVPETTNYQGPLPRRRWPNKGQSVRFKYQYIDGICKGDGRPDYQCRIDHYPLVGP